MRLAELEPTSSEILRELEKFLIETGARYVPGHAARLGDEHRLGSSIQLFAARNSITCA